MSDKSLILLYHFFHPDDVVSARLFSDIAIEATKAGIKVVAMPANRSCHDEHKTYPVRDSWEGGSIRRIRRLGLRQSSARGRILNALFMLIGWTWRSIVTRRSPNEVMIVGTDPILSVLIAIPWRLFRPRSHIIHWCHDLYPHAAVAEGLLRPNAIAVRILNRLLRIAYRRCDVVADLGMCMREKMLEARGEKLGNSRREGGREVASGEGLVARGEIGATGGGAGLSRAVGDGEPEGLRPAAHDNKEERDGQRKDLRTRFVTVTPWSLVEPEGVVESDARVRAELFGTARLGLLYSGNLGRAHEFEGFLRLARLLRGGDVGFCFAGRGPRMEELQQVVDEADSNVRFAGFADEEELALRLGAAHIHLVSLRESWTGTVVPSKFFGALAVGRPVLFSGSEQCAIADWIGKYDVGWVLHSGNESVVARQLQAYAADAELQQAMKQRCRETYAREFSKSVQIGKLMGSF